MKTLQEIEAAAEKFSLARAELAELVNALKEGIEALKRDALPDIRAAITQAEAAFTNLHWMVKEAPELFTKPRTVVMHGVKVGFEKGKRRISFDDADKVCRLIWRHFPDREDALIQTTYAPLKPGLATLTVQELKQIGCRVEGTEDTVVIKPASNEVDALVKALVGAAVKEAAPQ